MSLTKIACTAIACFMLSFATGCVGPMGCGPGGACGPLAFNSCDGCSDCEGCGELYVDPWINEPANCTDPCDQCGNHNGQSCGKCRTMFDGLASLWGYRCDSGCDDCGATSCDGGCGSGGCGMGILEEPACGCEAECSCGFEATCGVEASCGFEPTCGAGCGGCASCSPGQGMHYVSSEPYQHDAVVNVSPTPAKAPYQPHRTRKIFRPKTTIANERQSLR